MELEPALYAIALESGVPWAGKAAWACASGAGRSWEWRQALTMREAGPSSAGTTKHGLVYASQKLKYDPALLQQSSFEKLCILPAVVQF